MTSERDKAARDLWEAFSRFRRLSRPREPIEGLKHREVVVLTILQERMSASGTGIPVSELSEILWVTTPTVTQLINGLEAGGYVRRGADPGDRRVVLVELTEKGEEAVGKARARTIAYLSGLVEHLGEEDTRELIRILSRVFGYLSANRPGHDGN
jgi:DNA-binding MarR family transcriptional regulator